MKNNYSFNNEHFMHIIIIVLLLVIIVMLYMYHSKGNTYESFEDIGENGICCIRDCGSGGSGCAKGLVCTEVDYIQDPICQYPSSLD